MAGSHKRKPRKPLPVVETPEEAFEAVMEGMPGVGIEVDGDDLVLMTKEELEATKQRSRAGGVNTGRKQGRVEGRTAQKNRDGKARTRREETREEVAVKAAARADAVKAKEERRRPVSLVMALKRYLKLHPEHLDQVVLAVIHRARQGDPRMIEMIFNRIDGAVVQKQQVEAVTHVKRYGFLDPADQGPILDVEGGPVSVVLPGVGVGSAGAVEEESDEAVVSLDDALDGQGELAWAPKTLTKRQSEATRRALRKAKEEREEAVDESEREVVGPSEEKAVVGLSDDELRGILGDMAG